MRRINVVICVSIWTFYSFLFFVSYSVYADDCSSCTRKVLVRTYNNEDPSFNATVFLKHFGRFFRSQCIELGEDFQEPEYVLTSTLAKEEIGGVISLGITLGFTGGKIGPRKGIWEYRSGTRHYYYGDFVAIEGIILKKCCFFH